jgi:hypothetical protein
MGPVEAGPPVCAVPGRDRPRTATMGAHTWG